MTATATPVTVTTSTTRTFTAQDLADLRSQIATLTALAASGLHRDEQQALADVIGRMEQQASLAQRRLDQAIADDERRSRTAPIEVTYLRPASK